MPPAVPQPILQDAYSGVRCLYAGANPDPIVLARGALEALRAGKY